MCEVVYKSSGWSPRHPIAKITDIPCIVHHSGHVQVEVVLAGGELPQEGRGSAGTTTATRSVVEVGKRGLLHLVGVMSPEREAPHSVT